MPDSPLRLLSHFSVSLYSKLLERVGYAHTSVPVLSSFLMPTIIRLYPQDSTKTTLVQVTSELCPPPALPWPMYQQFIDTSSLGGLFTQLRNHSHSWFSSAPVLAPPLLPVVLLEGSSGLSPGPLLSLHWLRDVSSRLMTSKPHLCVNGSQIPFPTQSSLLVSSLNCLTAYLIPKLEPLTGTPD